jgi:hypothetical protein
VELAHGYLRRIVESVDVSALRRHSRAFRRSAGHIFQKADGSRRPLGIPTFEDKVAQRAIVMGLEATSRTSFPTGGKLDLETWQRIFFAEFDGQRDKRVIVKVMVKILTASWL